MLRLRDNNKRGNNKMQYKKYTSRSFKIIYYEHKVLFPNKTEKSNRACKNNHGNLIIRILHLNGIKNSVFILNRKK